LSPLEAEASSFTIKEVKQKRHRLHCLCLWEIAPQVAIPVHY